MVGNKILKGDFFIAREIEELMEAVQMVTFSAIE